MPPLLIVLLVLAHPDDETMIGGLLGHLEERGVKTYALYATRGEGGKIVRGVDVDGRVIEDEIDDTALAGIRRAELQLAARAFGIDGIKMLSFPDAPLSDSKGKPTRDIAQILNGRVWNIDELKRNVATYAARINPNIVITLGRSVATHAHHQAIAALALDLFHSEQLGPRAEVLYEFDERSWYTANQFPQTNDDLVIAQAHWSPKLKMTYGEFQLNGRRRYRSQSSGYTSWPRDEVLRPIAFRDSTKRRWLHELLATRPIRQRSQ